MINRHYNAHPWIPLGTVFRTTDQIYRDSVRELYEFCESGNLIDLWAYLIDDWYDQTGGICGHVVPHSSHRKTTMMIESHWKVLKGTTYTSIIEHDWISWCL